MAPDSIVITTSKGGNQRRMQNKCFLRLRLRPGQEKEQLATTQDRLYVLGGHPDHIRGQLVMQIGKTKNVARIYKTSNKVFRLLETLHNWMK